MTSIPAAAAAPAARPRAKRRRRDWPGRAATLLGLFLGILVILWPILGTYYNNWHASQFAIEQAARAGKGGVPLTSKDLAAARAYNAHLGTRTLLDPWGASPAMNTPDYKQYLSLLGGERAVMGTFRFPAIKAQLPILHGTSDWALDQGAGHVYGTALPVGGAGTHAALSAHRGLPELTAFDHLPDAKVGDQFFVDIAGETMAYQVTQTEVVRPSDISKLKAVPGKDLVTLVTCTPYGINSHRLLVTGSRIPWSKVNHDAASWHGFDWTIQSWMWIRLGCALATLLLMVWLVIAWHRDDRRRARQIAARRAAKATAQNPATA